MSTQGAFAPGALKVMVVDDAALARRMLADALQALPGVAVVASAPSGGVALQKMRLVQPDVCVIDLEMPEMDGIALIAQMRREMPQVRVLIHTANGPLAAARAVEALTLGANDILLKPRLPNRPYEEQVRALRDVLLPKVLQFLPRATPRTPTGELGRVRGVRPEALVIGVSTGGPAALSALLPRLPASFPLPVLIVQHMPSGFTRTLAERLDQASALRVTEARDGESVLPGHVYVAPGGLHLEVARVDGAVVTRLSEAAPENSCRPSADVLFRSAVEAWNGRVLLLVLTGMGHDGLSGARLARARGATVIAQDEATSVVWGMPGAVAQAGLADAVVPLGDLPAALLKFGCGRSA